MFLEHCRRIFSEIEAAEIELSQTHEAPRGTLRVSLPLIGILMMPNLRRVHASLSETILDLDFSDRVVDVIEEGFDAVVRLAEIGDATFDVQGSRHISPTPRAPTSPECRCRSKCTCLVPQSATAVCKMMKPSGII